MRLPVPPYTQGSMQTLADAGATPRSLPALTWLAAALAAGASLSYWITTDTETHSWSGGAVLSLIAGAALMGLAMVLLSRPWSAPTARTIYLFAAVGTTAMVIAALLPLFSGATSGHAADAGHAGHDVGGGLETAIVEVARTAGQVALIGVLVWLHRTTASGAHPNATEAPG